MTTAIPALTRQRFDRIRDLVAEHLELDAGELSGDSHFIDDHEADSLALIDVLAALEKEYSIEIDQARFASMVTVNQVYDIVAQTAGW
jgi:acyl carrier protein